MTSNSPFGKAIIEGSRSSIGVSTTVSAGDQRVVAYGDLTLGPSSTLADAIGSDVVVVPGAVAIDEVAGNDPEAVARLMDFWRALGANVEEMAPERHDLVLAARGLGRVGQRPVQLGNAWRERRALLVSVAANGHHDIGGGDHRPGDHGRFLSGNIDPRLPHDRDRARILAMGLDARRLCGERVAIFKAISEGAKHITAVAVVTENGGTPCGSCRTSSGITSRWESRSRSICSSA